MRSPELFREISYKPKFVNNFMEQPSQPSQPKQQRQPTQLNPASQPITALPQNRVSQPPVFADIEKVASIRTSSQGKINVPVPITEPPKELR